MIKIKRLRHIGIVVRDLERMIGFYTESLGFRVEKRFFMENEEFRTGLGLPGARAEGAHLSHPSSDTEIEFFRFLEGGQKTAQLSEPAVPGIRHIALIVENIEDACGELKDSGISFISSPVTLKDPPPVAGFRFVYFRDPEGNIIELNELS